MSPPLEAALMKRDPDVPHEGYADMTYMVRLPAFYFFLFINTND